jgi:hypothetical protein
MSEPKNARTIALEAVAEKEPQLQEPQVRRVVDRFFGRQLVFISAKDGRKPTERIVCIDEGGKSRLFVDCEQMIEALSGTDDTTSTGATLATTAMRNFQLLDRLAEFLGRLKGWQLLLGILFIAAFGAFAVLIVSLSLGIFGDVGDRFDRFLNAFGICVSLFIGVCALCFGVDAFFRYRTKYEQVRVRVQKEFEKTLALNDEEFNQLALLSVAVIDLERKTRKRIDDAHVGTNGDSSLALQGLHSYLKDEFSLAAPDKGGLIARWHHDEAERIYIRLTAMYKVLQKISKVLPA